MGLLIASCRRWNGEVAGASWNGEGLLILCAISLSRRGQ
jgi:hypothetical protein